MCNFDTLDSEEKKIQHEMILRYAESFGGKNFFLHLIEAIRSSKPHPLVAKNSVFSMELGTISWNKVIFDEKFKILQKARKEETRQDNFLPPKDEKNYKKVLNLVRTIKPIVFHVKPKNREDGTGFFFQAFDVIDDETTKLNPIFDALFFCSIDNVKKALNYKTRQ